MQTRILLLAGILSVSACGRPQVPLEGSGVATPAPEQPSYETLYLLRRVVAATEEGLYGVAEGSAVKVIEERAGKLLVETKGLRFEIDPEFATTELGQRNAALAHAEEREAAFDAAIARRMQIEDRKFLAEEDLRRRNLADAKINHLRNAIIAAIDEIDLLDAENNQSTVDSADDKSRRRRIAILEAEIANCNREIRVLSHSMIAEE
ncbi:MAG TPA: hypothetical protein VIS96_06995 [Terrimicrobiaceae bacterium]